MNSDTNNINRASNHVSSAVTGFIIASLIFIALVVVVEFSVHVPAIDADHAAARAKALAEIRVAEEKSLDNPGWIDQSRGVVRLPIDVALQMAAQAWQNPAQARADLIAREAKATAPAPVAPAKPNLFE